MHVLVVTTVHVPTDARILHRQVRALRNAGHEVTLAAAWTSRGAEPPADVAAVELPRAVGRHRVTALLAARAILRRPPSGVDLALVHDPELLLAASGAAVPVVWDVHEDLASSLSDKAWLPRWLRPVVACAAAGLERRAECRHHLLLAEHAYGTRFRRPHPVVPNLPWLRPLQRPSSPCPRVVYVGRLSRGRGVAELVSLGGRLREYGIETVLIGPADADVLPMLERARASGDVTWHGYLPNPEAVATTTGALAGLSLLRDEPNYRYSMPTKIVEYMERAVPVITTPLPLARHIVDKHRCGLVVPFSDVDAATSAVLALKDDCAGWSDLGRHGRAAVEQDLSWDRAAADFVAQLEEWAAERRQTR
jgi:glycosyltransferase involved in cell wall biosynthesis